MKKVMAMAGPLLGGLVATWLGMHAVFYFAGSILLLLNAHHEDLPFVLPEPVAGAR